MTLYLTRSIAVSDVIGTGTAQVLTRYVAHDDWRVDEARRETAPVIAPRRDRSVPSHRASGAETSPVMARDLASRHPSDRDR